MEKLVRTKTYHITILLFLPLVITCIICLVEYIRQVNSSTTSELGYPWFIVILSLLTLICLVIWLWYIIIVKRMDVDIYKKNISISEQNLKEQAMAKRYENEMLQRTTNEKIKNAIDLLKYFQDLDSGEKIDEFKKKQQAILSDFITYQLEYAKKYELTIETKL